MKLFKRLSIIVVVLALMLSTTSYVSASDTAASTTVTASSTDGGVYIKVTGNIAYFENFDTAWKGTITDQAFTFGTTTYNQSFVEGNRFITSFDDVFTDDYLYIFKTAQTVTSDLTVGKDIQIQAAHSAAYAAGPGEAVTHTFSGSITIQDGGSLSFVSGYGNSSYPSQVTVIFSKPIVVESGGTLNLRSANPSISNTGSNASTEDIFKLAESATDPLIQVNDGGSAVLVGVALETNGSQPAVEVNGELTLQEVVTHDLSITSTGNAPAISVGEGGTLKLEAPERTEYTVSSSSQNVPAIEVASGGTIEIPESSNIEITATSNNAQAVDLADGAIVKKGDMEITVSEENDQAGDNYVDNYGNIILAKGAKASSTNENDKTLNAAVILPDGTIIEGAEDTAPEVEYITDDTTGTTTATVTVPAGGSITDSNGESTTMDAGGTVTSDGTTTSVAVSGITLNQQQLHLYINTEPKTATLAASVSPENASEDTVSWSSSDTNVATVDENGTVTAVGNGTATITATAGGKSATCTVTVTTYTPSSRPSYTISTPSSVDNGTVTVSPSAAKRGATVTVTVTPDAGYEIDRVTVTDAKGNELALTDKGNGQYTFTMPASKVNVAAAFAKIPAVHDCPSEKFTDVDQSAWYHEGVDYAILKGMMNGTAPTLFEPNSTTTRAMIVTILYRLEGEPAVSGANPFTDVDAGTWYTDAVAWAADKGVVTGTTPTTFDPNDPITREQMAAILYRYASYKGYDVTEKADLTGYADAGKISAYAADAMAWTNAQGLVTGETPTTLVPQGNATRAQVATILMRFCENVVK